MISRQRAATSAAPQPAQRHSQRSVKTSERSAASKLAKRQNQRSDKTSAATKLPFGTLFADNVVKCN